MTWKVDHKKREIRVTVRLALWKKWGPQPDEAETAYIQKFTGLNWQELSFACYKVIVIVKCRSIGKKSDAQKDKEVPVRIDWPGTSEVDVSYPVGSDPLADEPGQRLHPVEGRFNPRENAAWQHELGHVLGLDDGYLDEAGQPLLPGHPEDMMWQNQLRLSPATVARMIRRSGKVDESELQCSLSFDVPPGTLSVFIAEVKDVTVHAWTCDWKAPTSDPAQLGRTLTFQGLLSFEAGYLSGDHNAPGRALLEAMLGIPTDPLANNYEAGYPVTFDVDPDRGGALSIRAGENLVLDGTYQWDVWAGVPVLDGPLRINGVSSESFFPGPPLYGYFTNEAQECAR